MTNRTQKRAAPSATSVSRKKVRSKKNNPPKKKQTQQTRKSARNAAVVSKESSSNKSNDKTGQEKLLAYEWSVNDDTSANSDDSDSDNDPLNDEPREKAPPVSVEAPPVLVHVNTNTVSTVTTPTGVIQQNYGYNTQTRYYGSIVVDVRDDKRVKNDLRNYLRKHWYQGVKFIRNDEHSRRLIKDSIRTKVAVKPNELTLEQFYDKYQNGINTAMSQIRHNSQLLARKNYLCKNCEISVVMKTYI